MNAEIICAIISAGGVVAASVISWLVSRSTASKEIRKTRITWAHEKRVARDEDFAKMVSAVSVYANSRNIGDGYIALEAVSRLRATETGALARKLDALHAEIENNQFSDLEKCLSEVIEQKRKIERK